MAKAHTYRVRGVVVSDATFQYLQDQAKKSKDATPGSVASRILEEYVSGQVSRKKAKRSKKA